MWIYNGSTLDSLSEDIVGFVYLITNKITGRKYIGRKLAWFAKTSYKTVTQKNGIKKKKKIHNKVDSDWRNYYGSSPELLKDVESLGKDSFEREILYICYSKSECNYLEAREQFDRRVLESDEYYNNNIMCKIHGSHIRGKLSAC